MVYSDQWCPLRVGPYELVSLLGAGGMGDVYKAHDTRLDRTVAIKFFKEQSSERFAREAKAVAALNHPHICTLYDVGPDYLVMEFVDGVPLHGPVSVDTAITYGLQILDALQAAHNKRIVHRDLKPANIFVTAQGVKLLDFGLATAAPLSVSTESVTKTAGYAPLVLTHEGAVIGTPAYMSPEQWAGQPADFRSDIYAFGGLLYEMLTGARAGRERTALKQSGMECVVRKCLANEPADRFASAAETKKALTAARPSTLRARFAMVAAASIVLIAMALLLWQWRAPSAPLTDQDVLIVADFDNRTGDSVFDTALKQALAFQLSQSPFLKAMDEAQVRQALTSSGRSPDARVTAGLASEICVREGEKATPQGTITSLGARYLLALEATNCQTGQILAREQVEVGGKEQVVEALARATASMRVKLGESLPQIEGQERAYVHSVTTSSLEALQAFYLGDAEWTKTGDSRATIKFYERATQLDPNFALAWTVLGLRYASVGDPNRWKSYVAKAYGMADRVSERERLFITAMYHVATGNNAKYLEIQEVLARTYPRDPMLHYNLAIAYAERAEWQQSLEEARLAIRHGPTMVQGYGAAASALLELDRTGEAKEILEQAFVEGVQAPALHATRLYVAYAENDSETQDRERRWFSGRPEEVVALRNEANAAAALGSVQAATGLYEKAIDSARQRNTGNPDGLLEEQAAMAALFENCESLGSRESRTPLVRGLCGDATEADKVVAQSAGARGNFASGPGAYFRGLVLLRGSKYREALAVFEDMVKRRVAN